LSDTAPEAAPRPRRRVSLLRWIIGSIVLIPLASVAIYFYTGTYRAFKVISGSMRPTLEVDDDVFMRRWPDDADLRGRVIAFDDPVHRGDILTKRVIGRGGDRVTLEGGYLYINGEREPGTHDRITHVRDRAWQIGPEELFVVGDNRNDSFDSIDFGPISRTGILGVVTFRYRPLRRAGFIR
jgi:signal peptidase I